MTSPAAVAIAGILLAITLGGCAETQLAVHAAKNIGPSESSSPAARGIYKIGDPYQIQGVWYYPREDYNYDETGIASWYGQDFHAKATANGEVYDMNDLTAAHRTLPMPSFVRVTNLDNGRSMVLRVNDRGPFARGRIIDISRRGAQLLGFEQQGTAKVRVQVLPDESRQIAEAMRAARPSTTMVAAARPPRVETRPGEPPPLAAPRGSITAEALPAPGARTASGASVAALPEPTGQISQTAPRRTNIYVQAGAFSNADNAQRLSQRLGRLGPSAVTPVAIGGQQMYRVRIGPLASVDDGDRMLEQVIAAGHPEAKIFVD